MSFLWLALEMEEKICILESALGGGGSYPCPFKNSGNNNNKKKNEKKRNGILIRRNNNVLNISIVKQLPLKSTVFALMLIRRYRSHIVQVFSDLLFFKFFFPFICKNYHGNPVQSHCCMMFSLHGSRKYTYHKNYISYSRKYTYHRNYISYSREHLSSSRIRSNHWNCSTLNLKAFRINEIPITPFLYIILLFS